jgi:hypothetical protein
MCANLPDYRYPDVTARRGQGGADAQIQPVIMHGADVIDRIFPSGTDPDA